MNFPFVDLDHVIDVPVGFLDLVILCTLNICGVINPTSKDSKRGDDR